MKACSSGIYIWLFELGTVNPIGNRNIPTVNYINSLLSEYGLANSALWSALALRDTATFVQWGPENLKEAVSTPLYNNATWDYFFLYLYCIYQRTALLKLQNYLIKAGSDLETRRHQMQEILGRMAEFRNRFWFAEITRKVLGNELYEKFQNGLGTPKLFDYVSSEIHALYDFFRTVSDEERMKTEKLQADAKKEVEQKQNRRANVFTLMASLLIIPSLVIGFLNINLKCITSSEGMRFLPALAITAGSAVLSIILGLALKSYLTGSKKQKNG